MFDGEGDELEKYDNPLQIKFQLMHAYKLKILRAGADRLERIQYFHKLSVLMSEDFEDENFNLDMDVSEIKRQLGVQYSQHDDLHMEMNSIILHSTDKLLIEAVLRLVTNAGPENAECLFLTEDDDTDLVVRLSQFIMDPNSSESFVSFSCMALSYAIPVVDNDSKVSDELIHFVMNRLKNCVMKRYPMPLMDELVVLEGNGLVDRDETVGLVVPSCSPVVDAEKPSLDRLSIEREKLVEFLLVSSIWLLTEVSSNHAILAPLLQENGLDVIFNLLKYQPSKTLSKTIDWISKLGVHQKFSSMFLSRGGLTMLMRLPFWREGVSVPAYNLSFMLCSIARSPAIQEQICLLPETEQLDLLKCSIWCFDAHILEATRAILVFLARMISYRTFVDLFARENYLDKLIGYMRENRKQLNSNSAQKHGGPALFTMIYQYFASVIVNTFGNLTPDLKYTPTPRYRQTSTEHSVLDSIVREILLYNYSTPSIISKFIEAGATQDILDLVSTHSKFSKNQNSLFKEMVYNGLQILWLISAFKIGQEDLIKRTTVVPKSQQKDLKDFPFFNNRSVFVSGTHFLFDLNHDDEVLGFFPDESNENPSQTVRRRRRNNHDIITIINQFDAASNPEGRIDNADMIIPDTLNDPSSPLFNETDNVSTSNLNVLDGTREGLGLGSDNRDRGSMSGDEERPDESADNPNSSSSIPVNFLDFIVELIVPPKDRQVHSDDPIMVALLVLLNFCFIDNNTRKVRVSTPKKNEEMDIFRRTLKTIRARDGLSVLVNLLKFHHVEHRENGGVVGGFMTSEWNSIRIVACRVLLTLSTDNAVKQVLNNRISKLVPELIREPTLPCTDMELLNRFHQLLGQLYFMFTGLTLSVHTSGGKILSKAERRAIAMNTQIRYSSAELLELIAQHLKEKGFTRTVDTLIEEAASRGSICLNGIFSENSDLTCYNDNGGGGGGGKTCPFTLNNIIYQFLYDQHMKCDRPAQVVPDFSLRYPHVCHTYSVEKLASNVIPSNVSRRWYYGQLHGHMASSAPQRIFQYSQFSRNHEVDWEGPELLSVVYRSNSELLFGSNVGIVFLWDIDNGQLLQEWECSSHDINRLQYNERTNRILTPGDRKDSVLWDLDHMDHAQNALRIPYIECSISHDGLEVIGLNSKKVVLWDVEAQREIGSLLESPSSIKAPQFSPDDALILQMTTLWDKRQPKPIHRFDLFTNEGSEVFHPNGLEIVIHSEVWDLRSFKLLKSCPSLDHSQLLFGNHGEILLACKKFTYRQPRSARIDRLQLLDALSYDVISAWSLDNEQCSVAIHPDDVQFVVVSHNRWRLWDMKGGSDDDDNVSDRLDNDDDDDVDDVDNDDFDSENDEFSDLLDTPHENSTLSYSDDNDDDDDDNVDDDNVDDNNILTNALHTTTTNNNNNNNNNSTSPSRNLRPRLSRTDRLRRNIIQLRQSLRNSHPLPPSPPPQ